MISFGKLTDFIEKAETLTLEGALAFSFSDPETQEEVIRLNTDEQLFNQGIDSTGESLESIGGSYSPFTIRVKRAEGVPHPRGYAWVTLYQSGEFYSSFKVEVRKDSIIISADTIKEGEDLQDRWGDEIIGLTDESIQTLNEEFVSKLVIQYILKNLIK